MRNFTQMIQDAAWAVFQEHYQEGYGAGGDHLKSLQEVKEALDAGVSMITLDPTGKMRSNRDAVKLETPEANGLYQNILNPWDPLLFVDLHLMGRVRHGYANTYATSTVPAAHPGPRAYMRETLFPAVRESVRRDFGLETFTHALADDVWPPTVWSHDNAIWSTEAKFVVSDYGLRNRMAIITETPGHPTFERGIYAQYAYALALLEYTNAHAADMLKVVRAADDETVAKFREARTAPIES